MFYNTIHAEGAQLHLFESLAKSDEAAILQLYKITKKPMCWFEVKNYFPNMNECSLKRAITNLKNKSQLKKTDIKILGSFGKPCYKYQII